MILGWVDLLGYAASGLTVATFAQRTMLPMRILAIGANFCFIGYGAMGLFMPVLMLHLILLPINIVRLFTLVEPLKARREETRGEVDQSALPGLSSGLL